MLKLFLLFVSVGVEFCFKVGVERARFGRGVFFSSQSCSIRFINSDFFPFGSFPWAVSNALISATRIDFRALFDAGSIFLNYKKRVNNACLSQEIFSYRTKIIIQR